VKKHMESLQDILYLESSETSEIVSAMQLVLGLSGIVRIKVMNESIMFRSKRLVQLLWGLLGN